jgi:hypothetical protein
LIGLLVVCIKNGKSVSPANVVIKGNLSLLN